MIQTIEWRLRLPASVVLALIFAGCGDRSADRPAPPETVAPAPAVTVTPAEDRGHENASSAPQAADGAFDNVDSGESERAASERGHQSAGGKPPATQPGSGP